MTTLPEILCSVCGRNSIPAPPGTTPRTRFVCRECCPQPAFSEPPEDVTLDVRAEAGAHATQGTPEPLEEEPDALLWTATSAEAEACLLFAMLGRNGDTPESLRKLIAVPPRIEAVLRTYARQHPETQEWIERALGFRAAVLAEFVRLVRERANSRQS